MRPNNTPQPSPGQDRRVSKRAKLIDLGRYQLRRRSQNQEHQHPGADPRTPKLQAGTTLGYFIEDFSETLALQVQYGSEQNVWIKGALLNEETGIPSSWRDFESLDRDGRFTNFALVGWRNGITSFSYNGDQMEPDAFPLHSPEEAVVQYKTLLLYWHFTQHTPLYANARLWANPDPEYVDPDNPGGLAWVQAD